MQGAIWTMRWLTILVAVAALLWSGWWWIGSSAMEGGVTDAIASARDEGWEVETSTLSVGGYPNRFDTTARDLAVTAPDGAWGVDLAVLQVLALSYRPGRFIAVPSSPIAVATPTGPVEITHDDIRASAAFALSTDPALLRATAVGETLALRGTDWIAGAERAQLSLRANPEEADAYDMALSVAALTLGGAALDPRLPDRIDTVSADGTVFLDGPPGGEMRIVRIALRDMAVAWDDIRVALSGDVEIGRSGLARGELLLRLTGWRELLTLSEALGLPRGQAMLLAGGLGGLETDGRVEVPLNLRDGTLFFGAIPLAPLPRYNP